MSMPTGGIGTVTSNVIHSRMSGNTFQFIWSQKLFILSHCLYIGSLTRVDIIYISSQKYQMSAHLAMITLSSE